MPHYLVPNFLFQVTNLSGISIVTLSLETDKIISRQGTPVSPTAPVTFLYGTAFL